jgi:hypothetical protein
MIIIIYTLSHPINKEVRYVGRTRKIKLSYRLTEHMSTSESNHNSYKKNWIKKLSKEGLKPIIEEIETLDTTWEESHFVEKYWIQQFKAWNFNLVNLEDKGKGGYSKYKGHSDKAIIQYDLEGNYTKEYKSIREASRQTDIKTTTIEKVLWNISKIAGNYQWKYKTDNILTKISSVKIKSERKEKTVFQFDLNNNLIKEWKNSKEASDNLGFYINNIRLCASGQIQKYKGFKWKYKND